MSLRIGIDVDGVLADFRTAFHETSRASLGRRHRDRSGTEVPPSRSRQDEVKRVWETVARTPNWWMTLKPYEPDQIARLYSLTRAAGWEVFFLTNRPRERRRLGAVPDAVVDRAPRLLHAVGADGPGLARRGRQRPAAAIWSSTTCCSTASRSSARRRPRRCSSCAAATRRSRQPCAGARDRRGADAGGCD